MHILLVSREYNHVDVPHALMTIMYLFIQLSEHASLPVLLSLRNQQTGECPIGTYFLTAEV